MRARVWERVRRLQRMIAFVRQVIDERTLDLNLLETSPAQRLRYRPNEIVRLIGALAAGGDGDAALADLSQRVGRRRVRCFVHGRDEEGRLIGVVVPVAGATRR